MRARQGSVFAQQRLAAAEQTSEALEYLHEIFLQLNAMREYDMNGPRRFTPQHIKGAMDLFEWALSPMEVRALVAMDAVSLAPGPWPDEVAER